MTVLSQQSKRLRVEPLGVALVVAGFLVWQARVAALGPALALPAGLVGAVIIDAIWSLWVTRPIRVQIVLNGPEFAVEGTAIDVYLQIDTRRRCTGLLARLALGNPGGGGSSFTRGVAGWRQLRMPAKGHLTATARRRGVYDSCQLALVHTAPLGLCGVEQFAHAALVRPITVTPRLQALELPEVAMAGGLTGAADPRAGRDAELLRGTRPFQPGDDLRHVHWAQLARTQQLTVREFDSMVSPTVRIVADLGAAPGEQAEQVARWAAFAVQRQLDLGYFVELVTWGPEGRDVTLVRSGQESGRCLALAETGEPAELFMEPTGQPTMFIGRDGAWLAP